MRRSSVLVRGLLLRSLALFALWLLLVDDPDQPDVLTGIVTALGTAALVEVIVVARGRSLRIRPQMLRHLHRPLLLLLTDTLRVTGALARAVADGQPRGALRVAPYRATDERDPEASARRLLTQWGASLGANRYVIGIDQERGQLIVHELVPARGALDPLELG